MEYTHNELKILWHLKRNGGVITAKSDKNKDSIVTLMAETLDMRRGSVGYHLRTLEQEKCLIVRTFKARGDHSRGDFGILIKVELIDPQMYLPPLPGPMPLAAIVSKENEELYDRTLCEADDDAVILALVTENEKLRFQINKLQEIVAAQAKEIETLKRPARRERSEHLNQRVQDALPPDVWDQLHHKGRR